MNQSLKEKRDNLMFAYQTAMRRRATCEPGLEKRYDKLINDLRIELTRFVMRTKMELI